MKFIPGVVAAALICLQGISLPLRVGCAALRNDKAWLDSYPEFYYKNQEDVDEHKDIAWHQEHIRKHEEEINRLQSYQEEYKRQQDVEERQQDADEYKVDWHQVHTGMEQEIIMHQQEIGRHQQQIELHHQLLEAHHQLLEAHHQSKLQKIPELHEKIRKKLHEIDKYETSEKCSWKWGFHT